MCAKERNARQGLGAAGDMNLQLVYMLVVIGFACLCAWELTVMFSPIMPLTAFASTRTAVALYSVLLASSTATALILHGFAAKSRWTQGDLPKPPPFFRAPLLLLPYAAIAYAAIHGFLRDWRFPPGATAWALTGIGQVLAVTLWGVILSSIPSQRTASSAAIGSTIGTALFVLLSSIHNVLINLLGVGLTLTVAVTIGIFLFSNRGALSETTSGTYRKSPETHKPSLLTAALSSSAFGFVLVLLASFGFIPAVIGAASGIIGAVCAILWSRVSRFSSKSFAAQFVAMPVIVVGFLVMLMNGPATRIICCCAINAAHAFIRTSSFGSLAAANADFRLQPYRHVTLAMIPTVAGLLGGVLLGFVTLFAWPVGEVGFDYIAIAVAGLFACMISANALLVLHNTRRIYAHLLIGERNPLSVSGDADGAALLTDKVVAQVEAVSVDFRLTPRESDVLSLLARGRNSYHIQKQLVLAPGTVKTHIQHIYQKANVSSHQELLDLLESYQ